MKTFRLALISLLLPLALAACAQQDAAPAAATAAAPAAAEPSAAPAPIEPVAGTHYVEISDPQPYFPLNGQIEVVEVFGYTCPACASFEPLVSAWKERQPDDVRVSMLAAPFGGFWQPYAKAFYAAESMDLADATHKPMFDAVHRQRSLPAQGVTNEALADFYAGHGADACADQGAGTGTVRIIGIAGLAGVSGATGEQHGAGDGGAETGGGELAHGLLLEGDLNTRPR